MQLFRKDVQTSEAHTNNISEGRVGSFKKGLKTITDGSIFSAVKYLLETYIPNDFQDFKTLNRDNAWENKRLVRLKEYPLLQNRPPGAVVAIKTYSHELLLLLRISGIVTKVLSKDAIK